MMFDTTEATATRDGLFGYSLTVKRPAEPSVDYLIAEAHQIIDRAFTEHLAVCMLPLFSGGNDSACASHVASLHHKFPGTVYTINTRTGAFATKKHQRKLCKQFGWKQEVRRSQSTYEKFIRERGCPGPGRHQWVYQRLKDHVIKAWVQEHKENARPVALITGCRASESTRRLGHAAEIKRGQSVGSDGKIHGPYELWVAPILHWTGNDKQRYMRHFGIPLNPFSDMLGMSGECCCGAFAQEGEAELWKAYAPDVYRKIKIAERIAKEHGNHCEWGTRPPDDPKPEGPIPPTCQSCYAKTLFSENPDV